MRRRWMLPAAAAVAAASAIGFAYQRDIDRARQRIAGGSTLAQTACGPIEYARTGSGPPLVVVHGAGGGFDQGLDFGRPIARGGVEVIAMSRFGYLRTPMAADPSPAAQADAHACLLDTLGIGKAAVAGISAGAPSAMQFAIRHPHRTASLVLVVPAAYAPRADGQPAVRAAPGTELFFETALRLDFAFWAARRLAPGALTRSILATPLAVVESAPPAERARVERTLDAILPVSARRLGLLNDSAVVGGLGRFDLGRIAAPTLVIGARDDLFHTWEAAGYTASQVAGARLVGYPSGGHLLVGHGEESAGQVARFVRANARD